MSRFIGGFLVISALLPLSAQTEGIDRAGAYVASGRLGSTGMASSLVGACQSVRLAQTCVVPGCVVQYETRARGQVLQALAFVTAVGGAVVGLASADACAQAVSLPLAGAGALMLFLSRQGGCSSEESGSLLGKLGMAASVASLVTALTVRCKDAEKKTPQATPSPNPQTEVLKQPVPTPIFVEREVVVPVPVPVRVPDHLKNQIVDLSKFRPGRFR